MKNVDFNARDNSLVIRLIGHIDSANAAAVEQEIANARAAGAYDSLTVDCSELNYISSAGLRIILRLRKECPKLKVTEVSSEVYEVFELTGFTEMIDISKAYRVISVDGCEVIGQGANGKVYRIDRDTIVKVYLNPDSLPDIQRERELARKAFVLGVPTAIPYDVVRVGDGYGSVFELLNAKSFAKLLKEDPSRCDEVVGMSVDLLKKIHSTELKPGEIPDMKAVALDWADFLADYLPKEQYEKLHALIAAVPDDNHMMHGDYHVKNVMLQEGEALLIDMDTLCTGHPGFELASMYNAYVGYSEYSFIGAVCCTLALILPCFTVATIVSFFKKAFQDNKYVKNALFGIRAMVVGMILTAVLSFADGSVLTSSVKNLWKKGAALPSFCWQGVVIFTVIAIIELKWKLNTILSITIAGLLGLALFSL